MFFVLYFLLTILTNTIWSEASPQQCLQNFPNFTDGSSTSSSDIYGQLIIPQYAFPCDGLITHWEAQIDGTLESYDNLEFQVWRFDSTRRKYFWIGSSSSSGEDITLRIRDGVVLMKLESLLSKINVMQGDVPGIFIRDPKAKIKFFNHYSINQTSVATYVYHNSEPLGIIATDDEHYRSAAPLIRAQLEINDENWLPVSSSSPDETTKRLSDETSTYKITQTEVSSNSGGPLSLMDSPETHPIKVGTSIDQDLYDKHRLYLMIGIAVAVGIIVLMCVFIAIVLLVICAKLFHNRSKKCVVNEIQSIPKGDLSRGYSSENCSLSFLPIDSTSRLNLMAFRRQEATRSIGSAPDIVAESRGGLYQTNVDDALDSDMYVEIPPRIHLAKSKAAMGCTSASNPNIGAYDEDCALMKANSSYMVLHSANPETHMYDEVPCTTVSRRPCEYEIPTSSTPSCSSTQPTPIPHAEEGVQADKVIYEEI